MKPLNEKQTVGLMIITTLIVLVFIVIGFLKLATYLNLN